MRGAEDREEKKRKRRTILEKERGNGGGDVATSQTLLLRDLSFPCRVDSNFKPFYV